VRYFKQLNVFVCWFCNSFGLLVSKFIFERAGHSVIKSPSKVTLSLKLNYEPRHKNVWLSGGIAPLILYFSTRWRWIVTFMPLLIYIRCKSLRYTLDRRLRGNQGRSGLCDRKTFCRAWESNTDFEVRILKSEVMLFNWIVNYEMKWLANENQTR
jgi:hypothetical protein